MGKIIKGRFDADSFYDRAVNCIEKERYIEAIGYVNTAIKLGGDKIEYLLDLGDCYRVLGITDRALKCYFKILSKNKYFEEAYVGIMQAFIEIDRPEMSLFYLSMGLNVGALGPDYEPDEEALREDYQLDVSVSERAPASEFKLLSKNDCSEKIDFAKKLLLSGQSMLAKQIAEDVPKESRQFIDAQKIIASIEYASENIAAALEICDKILCTCPYDTFALSVKMAALHELGGVDGVEEIAKTLDSVSVTKKEDLLRIAMSFSEVGDNVRCARFYKRLNDEYPYVREIMLPCAIAHYNCKNQALALSLVHDMKKLFPSDPVVAYYCRHIVDARVDNIPVLTELPEGEKLRRLHRIEECFAQLQHLESVTERLDKDEELREMVVWMLTNPCSKISANVAGFLVQDEYWQNFIADLLLEPYLSAAAKKEYLMAYLKSTECSSFSILIGEVFQTFKIRIPKCDDTPKLRDCYYDTFATLAFITYEFSKKLNRAYKTLVKKMSEPDFVPTKLDNNVVCATLCYMSKAHKMLDSQRNCCEIFDCKEEDLKEFLRRLDLEKPQSVRRKAND